MTANVPPLPLPLPLPLPPGFPPELQTLAAEIHVYFRELPRLLDEGGEGKFVVIKGTDLFGTWDTHLDAIQHGRDKFEREPFLAQRIDSRLLTVFGDFFHQHNADVPGAA